MQVVTCGVTCIICVIIISNNAPRARKKVKVQKLKNIQSEMTAAVKSFIALSLVRKFTNSMPAIYNQFKN